MGKQRKTKNIDLTVGNITSSLWKFAVPLMLGNVLQQLYNLVDTWVVGHYIGDNALAAVGSSYTLMTFLTSIVIGLCLGSSAFLSMAYGKKDQDLIRNGIFISAVMIGSLAVILTGIIYIWMNPMIRLLQVPQETTAAMREYLFYVFIGFFATFLYNYVANVLRGIGNSVTPLFFLGISVILNIFLDLYMVAVLNLGVAGAAYATFIAQGISAVLSLIIFIVTLQKLPGKAEGWLSKTEFSDMSRIALPSILQQSTVSIGMMLVQSVVNSFGTQILAGFSAAMRIESLCVVPMSAIGNAMSSYTAQNIGAEKEERISQGYRMGNFMIIVIAVILCLFLEIAHKPLVALFLDNAASSQTIVTGESYLKFIGFFFCMIGFKMAVDGILRGAGAVRVFTIANLVNLTLRVTIAKFGAPIWGVSMVWYAVPLGWLANFLISYGYYRTGKHLTRAQRKKVCFQEPYDLCADGTQTHAGTLHHLACQIPSTIRTVAGPVFLPHLYHLYAN